MRSSLYVRSEPLGRHPEDMGLRSARETTPSLSKKVERARCRDRTLQRVVLKPKSGLLDVRELSPRTGLGTEHAWCSVERASSRAVKKV